MLPSHPGLTATVVVMAMLLLSGEAASQVPSSPTLEEGKTPGSVPFQAQLDLDAGLAYDDNLFWKPVGTADTIFRVTPTLDMRRATTRLAVSSRYRFDAERYTNHPELNAAFARQTSDVDATIRPDSRTTLRLRAQYWRTLRPIELNVTTGLAIGRQLASVGEAASEWTTRIGPHSAVAAGYTFATIQLADGPDAAVQSANFRVSRQPGVRDDLYVTYREDHWTFRPGDPVATHTALAGWSRRLTPATTLTLEGGPRLTGKEWSPAGSAAIAWRAARRAGLSLSYGHAQTVAVGIVGLIETDSLSAGITYRDLVSWDVALTGGAFRNGLQGIEIIAYQASADIRRALTSRVWLVMSLGGSFNSRRPVDIATVDEQIRQQSISLSLHVSPGRPRSPRSE